MPKTARKSLLTTFNSNKERTQIGQRLGTNIMDGQVQRLNKKIAPRERRSCTMYVIVLWCPMPRRNHFTDKPIAPPESKGRSAPVLSDALCANNLIRYGTVLTLFFNKLYGSDSSLIAASAFTEDKASILSTFRSRFGSSSQFTYAHWFALTTGR